eukprot:CAMPEP_0172606474 /NCGR_PEP_ID=MMETSP1068-20121228/26683_1 /TAXON_ID=35684 /ORGANISM="Pseudopedinella elastica, Strain CCMP716" /LENGTH=101 /DNA_ID=CAMNT_0013409183 /DNA_START=66 /DNA_END=371 /DNA_ORIENTATION=+
MSLVARSLSRAAPRALGRTAAPSRAAPRRNMAGDMDVKKNKFVEEWNGRREITEKSFEYNSKTTPQLLATIVAFPIFCYFLCKNELQASNNTCINGKPRYM